MLPLDKLKKCLELEKTGQQSHLIGQTISKRIPCFPKMIVHIEEDMPRLVNMKKMQPEGVFQLLGGQMNGALSTNARLRKMGNIV
jgi:hypothetical protein